MKADLTRKATLDKMVRLTDIDAGGLEKAGKEPTTDADEFADRTGFDADFLDGWRIDVPKLLGVTAEDAQQLRRGGAGTLLNYEHFSVIMSRKRRMPLLTAVNIDGADARKLPRISVWSFDGRIDKADQFGDALYDSNALDRGHMVRREDPLWGSVERAKIANEDTFHFTNSCPQMAGVNQKMWLGLENYILQHARADGMRVSVFTGPFFAPDDLEYRGALVPKAFWKVVAIVTESGRPSATAYKVDQVKELSELEFVFAGYKTYQISISQVIKGTGIDFGPLQPFDGFSDLEARTNQPVTEPLEGPENIRI
jgi:endonuclease G, mitochondrial